MNVFTHANEFVCIMNNLSTLCCVITVLGELWGGGGGVHNFRCHKKKEDVLVLLSKDVGPSHLEKICHGLYFGLL